ncbi:retrovirus-related pol polyprotein from transposon TNT 1-94 [Tanacetum coccineum]
MTEFAPVDSGLVVPVFNQGDDPIACLNKAMAFLIAVASLRFPSTNNQLRTYINSRNQATIHDDTVTVQQVQGRQGVVKCYNCQGEGHMAKQCTQPKRPRNAAWFKDKAMLAEAQEAGRILDEEKLAFLADPGIPDSQTAVLMANISNYGSDVISEVPHSDSYYNDMDNQSVHAMQDFEQTPVVDFSNNEIHSDSNIILLIKKKNNESVTAELKRYKERVKTFEQRLNVDLSSREKMIDSQMDDMIKEKLALKQQVDSFEQYISKQIKEKESLLQTFIVFKNESKEKENKYMENEIDSVKKIKELDNIVYKVGQSTQTVHIRSRSKMLAKQKDLIFKEKKVNTTPINYVELNKLSEDFGKPFVPQQELLAEQAFWFHMSNPTTESSDASPVKVEAPSELSKIRTTPDALTEVMNTISLNGESVNVEMQRKIIQKDKSCDNQNALEIPEYFENNNMKTQLQDKDTTICKLKEIIKSMRKNNKEEKVNHDRSELETTKEELENSVAKLLYENERLYNEINHVKQVFKDQFDSIKKTHVRTKEHSDSLIAKLNLKSIENEDLKAQIQDKVFVITSLKNDLQNLKGKEIVDSAA